MATSGKFLIAAAIDIGTINSRLRFSFLHEPKSFYTPWKCECTPTAVLLDSDGKFHSFGLEAEETYYEKLQENEADGWALFRRFKSQLFQHEWDKSGDLILSDVTSRVQKPALTIFAMSIRYLKDELIKSCQQSGGNEDDILFAITVPSFWDDREKSFMRKAAREAGIDDQHLKLTLESEAASVWYHSQDNIKAIQGEGAQCMVIVIGGAAVDITVHETLAMGKLEEVELCNGLSVGSSNVEENFISILSQFVGENTFNQFQSEYVKDMYELLRDFEIKKRHIKSTLSGYMRIKLPASLIQLYRESSPAQLPSSKNSDDLIIKGDKLWIEASIAKGMFSDLTENLTNHIKSQLKEKGFENIKTIIVVGGYAACELVQIALENLRRTTFPRKSLVFLEEHSLAVLKGSILYCRDPSIICARKAKFSYGIKKLKPFKEEKDDEKKKKLIKGKWFCERFIKLVKINQTIPNGHEVKESCELFDNSQKNISISLYSSNREDTRYISDKTCKELHEFKSKVPKSNSGEMKTVEIILQFGDAEIKVIIKHLPSGESTENYLDLT